MKYTPLLPEHRVMIVTIDTRDALLPLTCETARINLKRFIRIISVSVIAITYMAWPTSISSSYAATIAVDSIVVAHQFSEVPVEPIAIPKSEKITSGDMLISAEEWIAPMTEKPLDSLCFPRAAAKGSCREAAQLARGEHTFHRGIYLTANSIARADDFFVRTMDALAAASGSALVIDVKENDVFFDTTSEIAKKLHLVKKRYNLPEIVKAAKDRGIYTIARFVAAKDTGLAGMRPDTHIRHPETKTSVGDTWVDPSNATVLEYNGQLLKDIIESGIDEINLDYIRYPTSYSSAQVGLNGREKANRVEKFIQMAHMAIEESGADTKLGLSTYAILGWDYEINLERLGQDVVRFAPYVDVISPMAYPASFAEGYYYTGEFNRSRMYELVHKTLTGYADLLGEHASKLRPWIQGYRVTSKDMRDQIDAVYDAGLCGFTVWSPSNLYQPLYDALGGIETPC